jgi:hypothetical protein
VGALRLILAILICSCAAACSRPDPGPPPTPTPAPIAPTIREMPGRTIRVEGRGSGTSDPVLPDYTGGVPIGIDVVTLTHNGQSSFIVNAMQGSQSENVATAIGPYQGQRPLVVMGAVSFEVTADGDWSLTIHPMSSGGQPTFTGIGDDVSSNFTPPAPGSWNVSHDGQTQFLVKAHCLGGSITVEDATGAVQDTPTVQFPRGPCFWEVRADGAWSLKPSAP